MPPRRRPRKKKLPEPKIPDRNCDICHEPLGRDGWVILLSGEWLHDRCLHKPKETPADE